MNIREILSEQLNSNTKKIYYNYSKTPREELPYRDYGGVDTTFISSSPAFARTYEDEYGDSDNGNGYLYQIILTRPANFFNPSSEKDFQRMERYLVSKNVGFKNISVTKYLQKLAKTHYWQDIEIKPIIQACKALGYDGYVTSEDGFGNFAVFTRGITKIVSITEYDKNSKKGTEYRQPIRVVDKKIVSKPFKENTDLFSKDMEEKIQKRLNNPIEDGAKIYSEKLFKY